MQFSPRRPASNARRGSTSDAVFEHSEILSEEAEKAPAAHTRDQQLQRIFLPKSEVTRTEIVKPLAASSCTSPAHRHGHGHTHNIAHGKLIHTQYGHLHTIKHTSSF